MDTIVSLFLRRMRQPLLTLIVLYAVSILGLTLIPGQDADGNTWYMDIFHAFYFVSYMATTIGFGEIPFEFTDAQRMWVLISLYGTVIGWIYALGTILSLLQDEAFQRALEERSFTRRVKGMREPFYLICGYGETGQTLVRTLTDRGQHAVVMDKDPERINLLQLQNLRDYVPALHGDAERPHHLSEAGLAHKQCAGVVAVTDDNAANLKVAITAKLLHKSVRVICRADSREIEANMDSFGTDHIIDPFDTFSAHLATAFQAPCLYLLQAWLTGEEESPLSEPVYPPVDSYWVVCGYGRFGKSMVKRLSREGVDVRVIEARPEITGTPPPGYVVGRGTEASTLLEAGLENAAGIIAGTNNDVDNLSIVMTAADINPHLFTIVRQNRTDNHTLFDALNADMIMHSSGIIADKIRVLLGTPMLHQFIDLARKKEDAWACELISRVSGLVTNHSPEICEIPLDAERAEAVLDLLQEEEPVRVGDILRDPWERQKELPVIVLLIQRFDHHLLLPEKDTELREGDKLLLCGRPSGVQRLQWNLAHGAALNYSRSGRIEAQGFIWRHFTQRLKRNN